MDNRKNSFPVDSRTSSPHYTRPSVQAILAVVRGSRAGSRSSGNITPHPLQTRDPSATRDSSTVTKDRKTCSVSFNGPESNRVSRRESRSSGTFTPTLFTKSQRALIRAAKKNPIFIQTLSPIEVNVVSMKYKSFVIAGRDYVEKLQTLLRMAHITVPGTTGDLERLSLRAGYEPDGAVPMSLEIVLRVVEQLKRSFVSQSKTRPAEDATVAFTQLLQEDDVECKETLSVEDVQNFVDEIGLQFDFTRFLSGASATFDGERIPPELFKLCAGAEDPALVQAFIELGGNDDLSGNVPQDAFIKRCGQMGLSEERAKTFARQCDLDGNGRIDYTEFQSMIHRLNENEPEPVGSPTVMSPTGPEPQVSDWMRSEGVEVSGGELDTTLRMDGSLRLDDDNSGALKVNFGNFARGFLNVDNMPQLNDFGEVVDDQPTSAALYAKMHVVEKNREALVKSTWKVKLEKLLEKRSRSSLRRKGQRDGRVLAPPSRCLSPNPDPPESPYTSPTFDLPNDSLTVNPTLNPDKVECVAAKEMMAPSSCRKKSGKPPRLLCQERILMRKDSREASATADHDIRTATAVAMIAASTYLASLVCGMSDAKRYPHDPSERQSVP